jgi:pimeloyl-ACP methyl ester carboxylesterase
MERPTTSVALPAGPVEYRLEQRGDAVVLVLHGGHMRAGLSLGEEVFADAGYTILAPSRPGYGRTPLTTGTSELGFADVTRSLCDHLGITEIAAVVGVSAGGHAAVALAARHPDLVRRVILQSSVGPLPWPDRRTRLGARVLFAPGAERVTWAAMHALIRKAPDIGLRTLLRDLSTLPVREVLAALDTEHRNQLIDLFTAMRSGSGFRNDLNPNPDVTDQVTQPTLVIATRKDGAVPFTHAVPLAAAIPHAHLVESQADSHFIWFGPDWPAITETVLSFLTNANPL